MSEKPTLVVVDVQRAFDDPYWGERNNPDAEANVARLLAAWRTAKAPIIHVRHREPDPDPAWHFFHEGDPGFEFKPEAMPVGDEPVLTKATQTVSAPRSARAVPPYHLAGQHARTTFPGMDQPIFRVVEPTVAFLQPVRPPASHEWSWKTEITIVAGTRLAYRSAGGYSDACSTMFMDWDEFEVLDGAWAGQVVLILDAGTPRDGLGRQSHWGWRPRLGPPPSIVADPPLPLDWRYKQAP